MSDPRPQKLAEERAVVLSLLESQLIPFQEVRRGPDPPDIEVVRSGLPDLHIEITRYTKERDRAGAQDRWDSLREEIDDRLHGLAVCKGVAVSLNFHDPSIPSKTIRSRISEEVERCVLCTLASWPTPRDICKLSFDDKLMQGTADHIQGWWFSLSAQDYPQLGKHVKILEIHRFGGSHYLPCFCYNTNVAWTSPTSDAIKSPLQSKSKQIETLIAKGRYRPDASPLWLVLTCDHHDDLTSMISGDPSIVEAVAKCGFDLERSPFHQVWLVSVARPGYAKQLL